MRILITGAKGQLGQEFLKIFSKEEILATDRDSLDITNQEAVAKVFKKFQPKIVLHCAAYTQVDQAEVEKNLAFLINAQGTANVAESAAKVGAKTVYISTDYVFDGAKDTPYTEKDLPHPINVYGWSKLKGEQVTQKIFSQANSPHFAKASRGKLRICLIVRTSWLYGQGHNFVETILNLAKDKKQIKVVSDQIGSPTWAKDLAKAVKALIEAGQSGIFHVSGRGKTSWFEFAKAIVKSAGLNLKIEPTKTKAWSQASKQNKKPFAPRPLYSYLSTKKLDPIYQMPVWQDSLKQYLNENSFNLR